MTPNSAADRAFLAEPRDDGWARWCEGDVMRRLWGICAWSRSKIEEIVARSSMCRVTVDLSSPAVLASLYTNIAIAHLYGDGVSGVEWNELPSRPGRFRAVFYLAYPDRDSEMLASVRNSRTFELLRAEGSVVTDPDLGFVGGELPG